jgi:phosphoribosylamine--glycine ligase
MARVLVIGGGGREHALARGLSRSSSVERVFVAPGNDGMVDVAECVAATSLDDQVRAASELDADLVVIGPEQPLVDGLADRLRAAGRTVFGPDAVAATIEGDKAWSKELMIAAGVPTARAAAFDRLEPALEHVRSTEGRCVVKATGLAAGKGVTVCSDVTTAEAAVRACLVEAAFGDAGSSVLIEERLEGPELSVFAVSDGQRVATFAPSRDHKRLRDGDDGPNTGGMGAYTPVADATDDLVATVSDRIVGPTFDALRSRGIEYRGLLYVGLMLTADGPRVLEYNCRFGDPETQVVLPVFDGDLHELLRGAAEGALPITGSLPTDGAAVGVVLASAGYPASSTKGVPIPGLEDPGADDDGIVFHAATRRTAGGWETDGGRVLCAVGRGPDVAAARLRADALADRLDFEGAQRRHDIGARERA